MNLQDLIDQIVAVGNKDFNLILPTILEKIKEELNDYHSIVLDNNFDKTSSILNIVVIRHFEMTLFTFRIDKYNEDETIFKKGNRRKGITILAYRLLY